MAIARFHETYRCAGVDQDAQPYPGMIVPTGGSNIVILDAAGMDLRVEPTSSSIKIEKFDGKETVNGLIYMSNHLMQPGVDSQFREAMLPAVGPSYSGMAFYAGPSA